MNPNDQRVVWGSDSPDWRTPPELFVALDRQFHFAVDVCASAENTYCDQWWGLDHSDHDRQNSQQFHTAWCAPRSAAFINPPYSRMMQRKTKSDTWSIAAWVEVCAYQAAIQNVTVVGVIPHSLQTEWWAQWVRSGTVKAHEIREIPHRVSFLRPDGTEADNAGGNTAIVVWQPDPGWVGDWAPLQRVWDYR